MSSAGDAPQTVHLKLSRPKIRNRVFGVIVGCLRTGMSAGSPIVRFFHDSIASGANEKNRHYLTRAWWTSTHGKLRETQEVPASRHLNALLSRDQGMSARRRMEVTTAVIEPESGDAPGLPVTCKDARCRRQFVPGS